MKREWYAVVRQSDAEKPGTDNTHRSMTVYASRQVADAHAAINSEDYPNLGPFVVVPLVVVQA